MTHSIRITTLGHSCVLIETTSVSGTPSKILLDPGTLTAPLHPIEGLDAILITHAHPDHVDPVQIGRLISAGSIPIYGDRAAAETLSGIADVIALDDGVHGIAGVSVGVSTWTHEQIYPGVPVPVDLGYLIADRVFAPGDAFAVPDFAVDVLLLPTGAPWMKIAESIDYMRAVAPTTVIPIHDGGLALAHREMHRGLMQKFAPEGTTVLRPNVGETVEVAQI